MNKRYETQLWRDLEKLQNDPRFEHQDILTITGFMNDQQLEQHYQANLALISKEDTK